jgi:hypothetical protein
MNRSPWALAVVAVAMAGCPASSKLSNGGAGVKAIVGDPAGACRRVAEVKGVSDGASDQTGLNRILNAAAEAGANAVHLRSGTSGAFSGTAYACPDLTKVPIANVTSPAKYIIGKPPAADCVDVGVVGEDMASNEDDLRARLTRRAAVMGGNVMRVDTTGGVRVVNGAKVLNGTGTVFFCP